MSSPLSSNSNRSMRKREVLNEILSEIFLDEDMYIITTSDQSISFLKFCQKKRCLENINFLIYYRHILEEPIDKFFNTFEIMYNLFLSEKSNHTINISYDISKTITIAHECIPKDRSDQEEIYIRSLLSGILKDVESEIYLIVRDGPLTEYMIYNNILF